MRSLWIVPCRPDLGLDGVGVSIRWATIVAWDLVFSGGLCGFSPAPQAGGEGHGSRHSTFQVPEQSVVRDGLRSELLSNVGQKISFLFKLVYVWVDDSCKHAIGK